MGATPAAGSHSFPIRAAAEQIRTLLRPALIAIDGPAASGKSTVGYQLAQWLDFLYFDTGVMYRAVTWAVLQRSLAPDQDVEAVGEIAAHTPIDIAPPGDAAADGRRNTVLVAGQDVTSQLHTPQIDRNVSAVAANAAVRRALTTQQRRIAQRYSNGRAEKAGIVLVGRDIGTVVTPDAPLKFYLDASHAERARRRFAEQQRQGKQVAFEKVLADIRQRDTIDSERALAPLRPADDAIVVDTSNLSVDEVLARMMQAAAHAVQGTNDSK